MLIQPIDYTLLVWFGLAATSTAYVAWDQFRSNPEPLVLIFQSLFMKNMMGGSFRRMFAESFFLNLSA